MLGALELPYANPLHPFSAGGLGFFAYDLKNHLERLPTTAVDDLKLPEMVWAFPRSLLVHDRRADKYWGLNVVYENASGRLQVEEEAELVPGDSPLGTYRVGPLKSNFTRPAYLQAIRRIRDYIRQGDVYQVNLAQRDRKSVV